MKKESQSGVITPFVIIIILVVIGSLSCISGSILLVTQKKENPSDSAIVPIAPIEETENKEGPFFMEIEDIFEVSNYELGKTVSSVVGEVRSGTIKVGDTVQILGLGKDKTAVVLSLFANKKEAQQAVAGDKCGIDFDIEKKDLSPGQVVVMPNTVKTVKKMDANVYLLKKEEGGRKQALPNNAKEQFKFRFVGYSGTIQLKGNMSTFSLGDEKNVTVEFDLPVVVEVGTTFNIIEGEGHLIGRGTVTKIYE